MMNGFCLKDEQGNSIHFTYYTEHAPRTAAAFHNALPFERTLFHARVSGQEIWSDEAPDLPVGQENASVFTEPGEVVISPYGLARNHTAGCFGIYYGEGRGLDACNIFAKVVAADAAALRRLGEAIWKEGARRLRFEAWSLETKAMNHSVTDTLILRRTDAGNPGFRALVQQLDAGLAELNGEAQEFYGQYNGLESIRYVILAERSGEAVGCGALKELEPGVMEVKRMFVAPAARRQGIAARVLAALEDWARELGYEATMLETGSNNPEAIALYRRAGYKVVPNYGQYAGVESSVCFRRLLRPERT
ncbi:GNAT family N-acetyltransferase [Flaviaesturariibacter terrae]